MAERPVVNPQRRPVAVENPAKVRSYSGPRPSAPQQDNETLSFLAGLSMFNKGLNQYADTAIAREADAATKAGAAAALAQDLPSGEAPGEATGATTSAPVQEPPFAFGEHWQAGYQAAVRQKFVSKALNDYRDAAMLEVEKPDFNPEAFSQQWWGTQLAGADQNTLLAASEARLKVDDEVRRVFRGEALKRATAAEEEANLVLLRDEIRPDMSPDEIATAWTSKINPTLASRGLTRKTGAERVAMLFDHLNNLSTAGGGQPELFDALSKVDPATGKALADLSPAVAARLESARKSATDLREHNLKIATEADRFAAKQQIMDDIRSGAASKYLTPEFLAQMISPIGLTDSEALSLWSMYRDQARVVDKYAEVRAGMARGDSVLYSKEDQSHVMTETLTPHMQGLLDAVRVGDVAAGAAAGQKIARAHEMFKSNAPSTQLKNFFEAQAVASSTKDPQALAGFNVAAEVFRSLPENLQRAYTTPDGHALFSAYVASRNARVEPAAALEQAHKAMDPDARARAKKLAEGDAESRKKTIEAIRSSAYGAAPGWLVGAGAFGFRPDNADQILQIWMKEAEKEALSDPTLTPEQILKRGEKWAADNIVRVRTGLFSGIGIQVPPGTADDFSKNALQHYYDQLAKSSNLEARPDWKIRVSLTNAATGEYTTYLEEGDVGRLPRLLEKTTLAKINDQYRAEKIVTMDDRSVMAGLVSKIDSGTVTFADIEGARKTIAKMEATGSLTREQRAKLAKADETVFKQASERMLNVVPLDSAVDQVNAPPPPKVGVTKRDPRLTREVAQQFLAGDPMGTDHRALSKAMITVGEEVMLGRYEDPAKGAGFNIGMGYNFNANAKTLHKDLERAGVIRSEVQKVIDGKAQITPRQAMNLLTLQLDRYEDAAQRAVEKRQPGAWARIPPRAKAALIDVAWQAGDPGQFTTAISKLLEGDVGGFSESLVVTYKDKAGNRKVDTRRNQMRSALLAGPARFKAIVDNHGKPTQLASK